MTNHEFCLHLAGGDIGDEKAYAENASILEQRSHEISLDELLRKLNEEYESDGGIQEVEDRDELDHLSDLYQKLQEAIYAQISIALFNAKYHRP